MPKSRGKNYWSRMTPLLFLISTSLALNVEPAPNCCSNPEERLNDNAHRNCTDDTTILLGCKLMYIFRPSNEPEETMATIVVGNETWLSFSVPGKPDSYRVSPNEYCLGKLNKALETVAMVCFPDQQDILRESQQSILSKNPFIFGMCNVISGVCMGLTFLIYFMLKELKEIQDKAITCMSASFMMAYLLLGLLWLDDTSGINDSSCVIIAFVLYYAFLSAFFWLNIISLNVWRHVWFPKFKIRNDLLQAIYYMIGWGVPLIFLIVAIIAENNDDFELKPGFGKGRCWFSGYTSRWIYFYAPIFALLIMNLVYLGMSGYKLWHQCSEVDCCKVKVLRFKCKMILKLALLMGFSWIFEVVSFGLQNPSHPIWILGDLINIFQGVIMFFLLVVCRSKVRKLLAQTRPCGIGFPKSWAASPDQEICEVVGPEELELSDEDDHSDQ